MIDKIIGISLATLLSLGVAAASQAEEPAPSGESAAAVAEATSDRKYTGFLGDDAVYERMTKVKYKDEAKGKGARWIGEGVSLAGYTGLLVEDVVFYPAAAPDEQVSAEVLEEIRAHATASLREQLGTVLPVVDAAGPGVVRIAVAITSVTVKTEGMKPYEVLPIAAVWGGLKAATGNRKQDVRVFVEGRVSDSASGDVLGVFMRQLVGEDLKRKSSVLTVADVEASIDAMSTTVAETMQSFQGETTVGG